jgi:hypothetical protein
MGKRLESVFSGVPQAHMERGGGDTMSSVTCERCGNYVAGHATGCADICTCEPLTDPSKEPLLAEVVGARLVVSIGVETLVWASAAKNGGPLEGCKVDGRRRREWANDVMREMTRENEIGESPLGKFLDEMMEKAANNGSGALIV